MNRDADRLPHPPFPVTPLPPDAQVLVALSGGPDSCALLLALVALSANRNWPKPVGAAHFHHGLRGSDADTDAAFSAALCARLEIPCVIGIGAAQPLPGESPNAAARRFRYEFLIEAARDLGAKFTATAHTRDDQAETVLGRILRGTSVDGLAGIPERRDLGDGLTVIRPLLGARRAEIEAYCAACGIEPRRDPSNEKDRYTRSRLRKLLPELADGYNRRIVEALARLAESASWDREFLSIHSAAVLKNATQFDLARNLYTLSAARFAATHPAIRRRALLQLIRETAENELAAEQAATGAFVERIDALITSQKGSGAVDLPGGTRAWRTGDSVMIGGLPVVEIAGPVGFCVAVTMPGETVVSEIGLSIVARERFSGEETSRERRSLTIDMAYTHADSGAIPPLVVRSPKIGERFAPLGMHGHSRAIRDLLAGVPASKRPSVPVVARADIDEPLWLVGVCQAESTRVDAGTERVLRLTASFGRE